MLIKRPLKHKPQISALSMITDREELTPAFKEPGASKPKEQSGPGGLLRWRDWQGSLAEI
jgi:hypothetical protein